MKMETKEMIVSDNSWKTTTGPLLHDAIFTGKFMMSKIWDIGIESPMMIIYGNQHYKSGTAYRYIDVPDNPF